MFNKIIKRKRGFTLIELIVVIAILGILAAVLVPTIGSYVNKANKATCASEASNFYTSANSILIGIDNGLIAETLAEVLANEGYGTITVTETVIQIDSYFLSLQADENNCLSGEMIMFNRVNLGSTSNKYITFTGKTILTAQWISNNDFVTTYNGTSWSEPEKV